MGMAITDSLLRTHRTNHTDKKPKPLTQPLYGTTAHLGGITTPRTLQTLQHQTATNLCSSVAKLPDKRHQYSRHTGNCKGDGTIESCALWWCVGYVCVVCQEQRVVSPVAE